MSGSNRRPPPCPENLVGFFRVTQTGDDYWLQCEHRQTSLVVSANRRGCRDGYRRGSTNGNRLSLDGLGSVSRCNRPPLEREDIALARELKKAHATRHRFFESPKIIPMIMIYTVGGDNGAGAVGSALAVH